MNLKLSSWRSKGSSVLPHVTVRSGFYARTFSFLRSGLEAKNTASNFATQRAMPRDFSGSGERKYLNKNGVS